MSEKTAKIKRAQGEQIVANIDIIAKANGTMTVSGIPADPILAMSVMGVALNVMSAQLAKVAAASQQKIVEVRNPLVDAAGRTLN